MEIEKTRETSWKIQLRGKNQNIELTSVENSGEVRLIKMALIKESKSIKVEMNKEEFFNFLSLISAFKDVVIGEEEVSVKSELSSSLPNARDLQNKPNIYEIEPGSSEITSENEQNEELDPEEWDPW